MTKSPNFRSKQQSEERRYAGRVMYYTLIGTLLCVALLGGLALIVDQHTDYATLREEPQ